MATKKKPTIIKRTETVTVTRETKQTYPVWLLFGGDQIVRFNTAEKRFQWAQRTGTDPNDYAEWEEMEWEFWLGDDGMPSKASILNTLESLTALIKATK